MLTVSGLVKRFGGFTAVNNVSFRVEQGEILGLIGPNGSGKSTIFNMLSGTLVPTAGSIEFDGVEIAGTAPHRIINRGIGRTFQIPLPLHRLSIFENVEPAGYYGRGSYSRAEADEAAERALRRPQPGSNPRQCRDRLRSRAGRLRPRSAGLRKSSRRGRAP